MAKNILYQFLLRFESRVQTQNIKMEHDVNRSGVDYIRIPCVVSDVFNTAGLRLKNHHISVFCNEDNTNPFLSQYHYTCIFEDNQGTTWRSHVFFNERDVMIHSDHTRIGKSMASSSTDSIEQYQTPPLFSEELIISMARGVITPVMGALRAHFSDTVRSLEQDYQRLEQEACALSDKPFREEYRVKLEEVRAVLKKLSPLVRHSYYDGIQKFISSLLDNISAPKQPESDSCVADCSSSQEASLSFFPQAPVSSPKKQRQLLSMNSKIEALIAEFARVKDASLEERADQFPELFARLNTFYLPDAYGKTSPLSADVLTGLHQLHRDLLAQGQQDFRRCLFLGDKLHLELASRMKVFHQLLSAQNIELALHMRNSHLLNFIFEYGDSSLMKMAVHVKGRAFRSPVHACVELDEPGTPMWECLGVLLRHDASLYQRADSGLPLGHVILSNKTESTLINALYYTGSVLYSPEFFGYLITAVNQWLASRPDLDTHAKEPLLKAVEEYGYRRTNAEWFRTLHKYFQLGARTFEDMVNEFTRDSHPLFKALLNDLDFFRLNAIQCELEMEYLSLCTEKDRMEWLRAKTKQHQSSKESALLLKKNSALVNLVSFDVLKSQTIAESESQIEFTQKTVERLRQEYVARKGKMASSQTSTPAGSSLTEYVKLKEQIGGDARRQFLQSGISDLALTQEEESQQAFSPFT